MIIAIIGPTGVGKTKLSIALAKRYHAEIINADSMQVYKGLDIGTAKIKEEEKEGIPHHLFDICEINDIYTVYQYQKDAREKIEEIKKRGNPIIFVGGTGLYLKAALFHYQFQDGTTNDLYENLSNEELLSEIKKYSLERYPHVNNRKRLVRLLNKLKNKETISMSGNEPFYKNIFFIYLKAPREVLYQKIDDRVEEMFEEGLLEEIKKYQSFYPTSKALQTGIGYKEFLPFFEGKNTLEEVKKVIKANTRHYAKRQDTFFRNQFHASIVVSYCEEFKKVEEEVFHFLDTQIHL